MNCQEIQEKLLAHRVGELNDAAAAALHQHLETCAACRAAAEETERVLDLMRSAFAAGPAAPARLDKPHRNRVLRAQFTWAGYGPLLLKIAASVLVVVGFLGLLLAPAVNDALVSGGRHKLMLSAKLSGAVSEMDSGTGAQMAQAAATAPGLTSHSPGRAGRGEVDKEVVVRFLDAVPEAPADTPVSASTATRSLQRSERRDGEDKGAAAPAVVPAPESVTRFSTLARSEHSSDRKTADKAPADTLQKLESGREWGTLGTLTKRDESAKQLPPPPQVTTAPPAKPVVGNAIALGEEQVVTFSGNISGSGALTKSGSGTLTLEGANTFGGDNKNGAGTIVLSANNTYSGGTTINAGTMVVNATAAPDGHATGGDVAANRRDPAAQPEISGATSYRKGGGGGEWFKGDGAVAGSGGAGGGGAAVSDLNGTAVSLGGTVVSAGKPAYYDNYAVQNPDVSRNALASEPEGRRDAGARDEQRGNTVNLAGWAEESGQKQQDQKNLTIVNGEAMMPLRTELPKPMLAGTPKPIGPAQFNAYAIRVENQRLQEVADAPATGLKVDTAGTASYAWSDEAKKLSEHRKSVDERRDISFATAATPTTPAPDMQLGNGRVVTPPVGAVVVSSGVLNFNGGTLDAGYVNGPGAAQLLPKPPDSGISAGEAFLPKAKEAKDGLRQDEQVADKSERNSFVDQLASNAKVPPVSEVKPTGEKVVRGLAADDWAMDAVPAAAPTDLGFGGAATQPAFGLDMASTIKSPMILKGIAKGYGGRFGKAGLGRGGRVTDAEAETDGEHKEAASHELRAYDARKKDLAALGDVSKLTSKDSDSDGTVVLKAGDIPVLGRLAKRERALEETEKTRRLNVLVADTDEKAKPEAPAEPMPTKPIFRAAGVNTWMTVSDQSFSTFSISVDSASFTLARRYLNNGQRPPPESVRTEEFVNYFDYAYAPPGRDLFSVHAQAARTPFCPPGVQLLKLGIKGRQFGREARGANLTFLLDTSGSMNAPDRLGLARDALKLLVAKLGPADRVALVTFSSRARLLLDFTPATEQKKILAALDGVQAAGFTHLEGGLKLAYRTAARGFVSGASNRVILMSDGVANVGADATAELLAQVEQYRKQNIFCSVFGLGTGTYDDTMLQALASKGNGTYLFMDSLDEARRVFVDEFAATLNKIAADVKIQVEFNPRRVKQYRQLGYEQRQLKTEDFRNDAVAAGEVGSGQSVTALYQIELQGDANEPLGTVRVRGRNLETGRVEELERAITAADLAPSFERADIRFQLAAAAAQFAEILRGSPYAEGASCADVAKVLRPIALELNLDQKVQELLRLVTAAGGAPQASE